MHRVIPQTSKQVLLLALALLVLCSIPVSASAETATDPAAPRKIAPKKMMPHTGENVELRQNMQEKRMQYENASGTPKTNLMRQKFGTSTEAFKKHIAERRAKVGPQVKERMKQFFGNMKMRTEAAIGRFEQIIVRIEARAKKMEEAGANTDTAEAHLKSAKESLDKAKALLAGTTDTEVDAVIEAEMPREKFDALKEKVRAVHQHLKDAHASVRKAVEALKAAAKSADGKTSAAVTNASSTDPE